MKKASGRKSSEIRGSLRSENRQRRSLLPALHLAAHPPHPLQRGGQSRRDLTGYERNLDFLLLSIVDPALPAASTPTSASGPRGQTLFGLISERGGSHYTDVHHSKNDHPQGRIKGRTSALQSCLKSLNGLGSGN
jgi:hypothetical protein